MEDQSMKKILIGLSAISLSAALLIGCEPTTEPAVDNQSIKDLDQKSQQKLKKDKDHANQKLAMSTKQKEKYEKDKTLLPYQLQDFVDNDMYAPIHRYAFVENYNKHINTNANYVVFVKDTDKFNDLYKSALSHFMKKHPKQTMIVYRENGQSLHFKDNKNIKIKSHNQALSDFKNDHFQIDQVPSLLIIDHHKIKGILVGYYDDHNLNHLTQRIIKEVK